MLRNVDDFIQRPRQRELKLVPVNGAPVPLRNALDNPQIVRFSLNDTPSGGMLPRNTIWDSIIPTQSNYEYTNLPRSFTLETANGSFWVHGNATEHIWERAMADLNRGLSPDYINTSIQAQLVSFRDAVLEATSQGTRYEQMIKVNGWELIFSPPRTEGLHPVIKHALYIGSD
jgi:hypothetical protein